MSGEAESDFDKGYAVNLDATRGLFEAIRHERERSGGAYRPRLLYASSIAVFGAPFPETIDDDFLAAPLTSYGAQKAVAELLIADYSRRGVIDGVALRLPTIVVRPGPANRAASGFFSSIIREPLCGREAVLPAPETTRHWCASPRAAVGFFLHAAALDLDRLGPRRSLTMPGFSTTVGEQIEALRRVGGEAAVRLIRRRPDEAIARIVARLAWALRGSARAGARICGGVEFRRDHSHLSGGRPCRCSRLIRRPPDLRRRPLVRPSDVAPDAARACRAAPPLDRRRRSSAAADDRLRAAGDGSVLRISRLTAYRENWLRDRLMVAHTAMMLFGETGEEQVPPELADKILDTVNAKSIVVTLPDGRRLVAAPDGSERHGRRDGRRSAIPRR